MPRFVAHKNDGFDADKVVTWDENNAAKTLTVYYAGRAAPEVMTLTTPKAVAMLTFLKANAEPIDVPPSP